jgi:hypothetical protein
MSRRRRDHWTFTLIYDLLARPIERRWLGDRHAGLLRDLAGEIFEIGAGADAAMPPYRKASRVVATEPDPASTRRYTISVRRPELNFLRLACSGRFVRPGEVRPAGQSALCRQ